MNPLIPRVQAQLSIATANHPLFKDYFDPDIVKAALEKSGITLERELGILSEAMDDPELKIRLKAQAQFRALLKEIKASSSVFLSIVKREDGSIEQTFTTSGNPSSKFIEALAEENTVAQDNQEDQVHERHRPKSRGERADPASRIADALEATGHYGAQGPEDPTTPPPCQPPETDR